MKNILIISDGIPGHYNQSKGTVTLLSESFEVHSTIHEMKWRFHALRSVITIISRLLLKTESMFSAKCILWLYGPVCIFEYDLIVAAGGNTAPFCAALRMLHGKPLIQLGSPRGMQVKLFSALVTVERYFDDPANVVAVLTPNLYSPKICSIESENANMHKHLFFLIGGKGIGYSYDESEWILLIDRIIELNAKTQLPITLVTSRRTNPAVEKLLKKSLSSLLSNQSAFFHEGAHNFNLSGLLGSAEFIFVTEDSAMMITESISSGKPVSTIFPASINSPARYENHLQKYADLTLMTRQPICDFDLQVMENQTKKINHHREDLKNTLVQRIGW